MTLTQCAESIGRTVEYRAPFDDDRPQRGVITSVNELVFVRYGTDEHSKATYPGYLFLIGGH